MAIEDQIIGVESGGDPYARNPYSSASGLGQFTDQTWLNTIRAHRPDLANSLSTQELLQLKTDPTLSRQMVGALAADNGSYLRSRGLDATPGNLYLAHFAGAGGASRLLGADDSAPVSSVLSPDAISSNPFLRNMTVGDLKAWAAGKMGQPGEAPAAAPAAAAGGTASSTAPAGATAGGGASSLADLNSGVSRMQGAGAMAPVDGLQQIAKMFAAPDQQEPVPLQKIHFPVPPGIARARALIAAMRARPLMGES